MMRAQLEVEGHFAHGSALEGADVADVLSTHLEWVSRNTALSDSEYRFLRNVVVSLCRYGLQMSREAPEGNHTRSLLNLTAARINFDHGWPWAGMPHLESAAAEAEEIRDPNQRNRVYRKLGMLYRLSGRSLRGFWWSIRACIMPEVPLDVRAKSLAALLGFGL